MFLTAFRAENWVSTLHRVVVPAAAARRQSMAFFVNINGDFLVDPRDLGYQDPKYPPISAKDHLMQKHLKSMGYEAKEKDGDN